MNKIQFDRLDLNQLRVLDLLLQLNSIAAVAARLSVTPSAVSHALARLRNAFGDSLFVRRSNHLEPTPRAREIGTRLNAALGQLRLAVEGSDFDPASTAREFTVLGHAYVTATILPDIMSRFHAQAPLAALRYMNLGHIDVVAELQSGRADVALGTGPLRHADLIFEELYSDQFVWVSRADHPELRAPVTLEMLSRVSHLLVESLRPVYGDELTPVAAQRWCGPKGIEAILADHGLGHAVGAYAPDTVTAIAMIGSSDMIALLPRRSVESCNEQEKFQLMAPPHEVSEIKFGMCYRKDRALEHSVAWLLDLVRACARAGE